MNLTKYRMEIIDTHNNIVFTLLYYITIRKKDMEIRVQYY